MTQSPGGSAEGSSVAMEAGAVPTAPAGHELEVIIERFPELDVARAVCSCGWKSAGPTSEEHALALCEEHAASLARGFSVVVSEAGAFRVPPCPWWCTRSFGHDLDDLGLTDPDGAVNRDHERRVGELIIVSTVEIVGRPGETGSDVPAITLDDACASQSLSAEQARQLVRELTEAVALIEQVTR